MASIIRSANKAGTEMFTTVGQAARMVGGSINAASAGIRTLEIKAEELADATAYTVAGRREKNIRLTILELTKEHVEYLEEAFKRYDPNGVFPYQKVYDETFADIEAAVRGKANSPVVTIDQIFGTAEQNQPSLVAAQ